MVRSGQPTGVLIPMVYLFGGEESKAKNSKVAHDYAEHREYVLTVNSCIKVRSDLQADKSPVVVKGPFFPRVVNSRYQIRGTMCNARIQSSKARKAT
jgi:hypothetical protein